MKQCDVDGCADNATRSGILYARIEDKGEVKNVSVTMNACAYHAERPDFFPDKPTPLEEIKPPMWKNFIQQGKQGDFVHQALVHIGGALGMMGWANNALEDRLGVPASIVRDMLDVTKKIGDIQESLRKWTGGSDK